MDRREEARRRRLESQGRGRYVKPAARKEKDKFLLANFRFFVSCGEVKNLQHALANADARLSWTSVELVLQFTDMASKCPICLSAPIAPKITKCGHVFCWPCILHYLSLCEHSWGRCPLCFEPVYASALKCFAVQPFTCTAVGDTADMILLRREPGSVNACPATVQSSRQREAARHGVAVPFDLPHEENTPDGGVDWPPALSSVVPFARFASITVVDPPLIHALAEHERKELQEELRKAQQRSEQDALQSVPFLQMALAELDAREEDTMKRHATALVKNSEEMAKYARLRRAVSEVNQNKETRGKDEAGSAASGRGDQKMKEKAACTSSVSKSADSVSYFYQSVDGQSLFMSSFNFRQLLAEFSRPDNFPVRLRGRVIRLETIVRLDDPRRKFRFLHHLPSATVFRLAELDLSEVISPATQASFEAEVREREHKCEQKLRRELQEERQRQLDYARVQAAHQSADQCSDLFEPVSPVQENPFNLAAPPPPSQGAPTAPVHHPPTVSGWATVVQKGFAAAGDEQGWAELGSRSASVKADLKETVWGPPRGGQAGGETGKTSGRKKGRKVKAVPVFSTASRRSYH